MRLTGSFLHILLATYERHYPSTLSVSDSWSHLFAIQSLCLDGKIPSSVYCFVSEIVFCYIFSSFFSQHFGSLIICVCVLQKRHRDYI